MNVQFVKTYSIGMANPLGSVLIWNQKNILKELNIFVRLNALKNGLTRTL